MCNSSRKKALIRENTKSNILCNGQKFQFQKKCFAEILKIFSERPVDPYWECHCYKKVHQKLIRYHSETFLQNHLQEFLRIELLFLQENCELEQCQQEVSKDPSFNCSVDVIHKAAKCNPKLLDEAMISSNIWKVLQFVQRIVGIQLSWLLLTQCRLAKSHFCLTYFGLKMCLFPARKSPYKSPTSYDISSVSPLKRIYRKSKKLPGE